MFFYDLDCSFLPRRCDMTSGVCINMSLYTDFYLFLGEYQNIYNFRFFFSHKKYSGDIYKTKYIAYAHNHCFADHSEW